MLSAGAEAEIMLNYSFLMNYDYWGSYYWLDENDCSIDPDICDITMREAGSSCAVR